MPLKSGKSQKTISGNIRELHGGKTYSRTAAKFGKARADKQAVAIALDKARNRALGGALPAVAGLGQGGWQMAGPPAGLAPFAVAMTPQGGKSAPPASSSPLAGALGVAEPFMASGGSASLGKGVRGAPTAPKKLTKGPLLSQVPGRTDAHATHVPSGSYVIPADIVSGRGQGNTLAGAQALQKLFKMGPYGSASPTVKSGAGAPGHRGRKMGFAEGGVPDHGDHLPVRVNLAGGEIVVPPENLLAAVHPDLKTAHAIMDKWVVQERKKLMKTLAKLPGPVKE